MKTRLTEGLAVGFLVGAFVMFVYGMHMVPQITDNVFCAAADVYRADNGQLLEATPEGPRVVGGIFSVGLFLMKWFFISLIAIVFACVLYVILSSLSIIANLMEKLFVGIGKVYNRARQQIVPTDLILDAPVGSGQTLASLLNLLKQAVKENQMKIKRLEERTADLPEPVPPKTPEELLREKEMEMAAMRQKLAKLEQQNAAKKEVSPQ